MLARIFSRVDLPVPLLPTMPKNSPRWTSKEIPESASRRLVSGPWNGCRARSLIESMRCRGISKVFERSRTSITVGPFTISGVGRLRARA